MKNYADKNCCFICGGHPGKGVTPDYLKCASCGHAILKDGRKRENIINEELDFRKVAKSSALLEYQRDFLLNSVNERKKLLDIGAGSGGFLFRVKEDFEKVEGLEITPECVEFAGKGLKVRIVSRVEDLDGGYSAITIWHALEHFSRGFLQKEMPEILKKLSPGGKVLLSVPNENSFAYKIMRGGYPYYDVLSHLQQFSPKSLNRYMTLHGFEVEKTGFSLPYSGFCWLQGLLNFFNRRHNYMYYRRKRGWTFGLSARNLKMHDILNFALAGALAPFAALGTVFDIIAKDSGATINSCYKRSGNNERTSLFPASDL